jgi:hypothetical protein
MGNIQVAVAEYISVNDAAGNIGVCYWQEKIEVGVIGLIHDKRGRSQLIRLMRIFCLPRTRKKL